MKKWTRKFLQGTSKTITLKHEHVVSNGEKAQARIKFPYSLWMELSKEWANCKLQETPGMEPNTAFAAGMAVGWAEHEKSVK